MWFKNARFYRLTSPLTLQDETLQSQLTECAFRPCGKQETATMGFSPPLGSGELLYHCTDDRYWFTLKKQERLLPGAVVNAELEEKAAQIEAETGSPLGKKAKSDLKQEIMHRLLPQAFTKNTLTHGFISVKDNLVVVDASADGRAEAFLAMLRKAMGSLPVVPLAKRSIQADLTIWLAKNKLPESLILGDEVELKSSGDDGVVRAKKLDISTDEVLQHVDAGKLVQKIALEWDDTLTCLLQEDLAVKRIKFTDVIRERNDDIPKDDKAARMDADFALLSAELTRFAMFLDDALSLQDEQ
ncbi:recombination-associated protein RdgC [Aestuariibacter salexigens]|uniref:recombination-associated protein RdgC n=1 Tax=Aestuariibacter salexigens TaxID=226010 RepID=UPI0004153D7B|nr:recombination-associated protein RdgC [Aestuariibacter salexigens]